MLVGFYAVADPHGLSRQYGVSVEGHAPAAFVRATGVRDIALGALLGATAYFHLPWLLVVIAVIGIAVSVSDLAIVWHHGAGRNHRAHALHLSGVVAFVLMLAMALFAIGR
ncbi:MAG: DUF4267 domain-containing protein [Candidatus Eremiobacteraeota bacterium]|nr:DUF4267 domain-containing protein [Candidatus Eremiobacteraeota bacterium]MBV9056571.1 DUF4267 domain-containing protein [Candidatus Eremiobacteraeota bacterium]MBV9699760.1 DUF4267 domain-containing protein [Candidatus Eremiobacteraeota bacterium]